MYITTVFHLAVFLCSITRQTHTQMTRIVFDKTKKSSEIAVFLPDPLEDNHCIKAAVQMSIDDVNRNSKVVYKNQTYLLTPTFHHIPRDETAAMLYLNRITDLPLNDAPLMLLGSPYNSQNEMMTNIGTGRTEPIPVVSFSGKTTSLNKNFRVEISPSIYPMMLASTHILATYKWERVSIIQDVGQDEYLSVVTQLLDFLSNPGNVTVATTQIIHSSSTSEKEISANFDEFERHHPRIIYGLFGIKGARAAFCQAFKRHMRHPTVVWILFESLEDGWAGSKHDPPQGREVTCTEKEILSAAHGYISITKASMLNNRTTNSLLDTYLQNVTDTPIKANQCPDDTLYAYDAIQLSAAMYKSFLENRRLLYFQHTVKILRHLKIFLTGVTGGIHYKVALFGLQRMSGFIDVYKNVGKQSEKQYLGTYTIDKDELDLLANSSDILFGNFGIPRDSPLIETTYKRFSRSVLWTMWGLAIAGCIFTITLMVINLIHLIRYESDLKTPIIDNLLIFGALLCYGSIFIYGVDTEFVTLAEIPGVCTTFTVALTLGFAFFVGPLLAKIWQMYKVSFENDDDDDGVQEQIVPEWKLLLIILAIFIGDVTILITWFARSSFHTHLYDVTIHNKPIHTMDKITKTNLVRCECQDRNIYVITLYCYNGIFLILGTFIFWQIRNSTLPILSNSKDIGMAICNVFMVSVIAVVCSSILSETEEYDSLYLVVAVCTTITVTVALILVFASKINGLVFAKTAGISSSESKFSKKSPKMRDPKKRGMTSSTPKKY